MSQNLSREQAENWQDSQERMRTRINNGERIPIPDYEISQNEETKPKLFAKLEKLKAADFLIFESIIDFINCFDCEDCLRLSKYITKKIPSCLSKREYK